MRWTVVMPVLAALLASGCAQPASTGAPECVGACEPAPPPCDDGCAAAPCTGDCPVLPEQADLRATGCQPTFWTFGVNGDARLPGLPADGSMPVDLDTAARLVHLRAWSRGEAGHAVTLRLAADGRTLWEGRLPEAAAEDIPVEVAAGATLAWAGEGSYHAEFALAGLLCETWGDEAAEGAPGGNATAATYIGEDLQGADVVCSEAPRPVRILDASIPDGVAATGEVPFTVPDATFAVPKSDTVPLAFTAWGSLDAARRAGAWHWGFRDAAGQVVWEESQQEVREGVVSVWNPVSAPATAWRLPLAPGEHVFFYEVTGVTAALALTLDALAC